MISPDFEDDYKHKSADFDNIVELVQTIPNDQELGEEIRKYIKQIITILPVNNIQFIQTIIEPIYDGQQTTVKNYKVVGQTNSFPIDLFFGTYDECLTWQQKNT